MRFLGVLPLLFLTILLIITTSYSFAQFTEEENYDSLLHNVLPHIVGGEADHLYQHGCFRYLHQNGITGCTSRSRSGDHGKILHLNTTADLDLYASIMEDYYAQQYPTPEGRNRANKDGVEFTLLIPAALLTTPVIEKFNKTSSLLSGVSNVSQRGKKPLFEHTDYYVSGIIVYSTSLGANTTAVDSSDFNYNDKIPFSDLAVTDAHRNYIWNPHGAGLISSPILFPITVLRDLSQTASATQYGEKFANLEGWKDIHSTIRDDLKYLVTYGALNWNLLKSHHSPEKPLPPLSTLPYSTTLSYYNSARGNTTHCLAQRTCGPLGGYNIISSLSTPNYIPHQPWLLIPVPYNTRGLFYDLSLGATESLSTLITAMITAQTLSHHYDAHIVQNTTNATIPYDPSVHQTPKKLIFALFSGEEYSHIGSRALLNDLWLSLKNRVEAGDGDDETPVDPRFLSTTSYFPCNQTTPGITRPPMNAYGAAKQYLCMNPFRTATSMFNGMDLRDLEGIVEISAPVNHTMYAHREKHGKHYDQTTSDHWYDLYNKITQNVTIFDQTGILHLYQGGKDEDQKDITPGIPLSASSSSFVHNLTYIDDTLLEKYNFTKGSSVPYKAPTTMFITNYNTKHTNKYKYSMFDDFTQLSQGDKGLNIFCAQITSYTRFLYIISHEHLYGDGKDKSIEELYAYANTQITIDCEFVQKLVDCFTQNQQCALLKDISAIFDTDKHAQNDNDDDNRDADQNTDQNNKPKVFSNPTSVYVPRFGGDIRGLPRLLYNWFYLSGYTAALKSNMNYFDPKTTRSDHTQDIELQGISDKLPEPMSSFNLTKHFYHNIDIFSNSSFQEQQSINMTSNKQHQYQQQHQHYLPTQQDMAFFSKNKKNQEISPFLLDSGNYASNQSSTLQSLTSSFSFLFSNHKISKLQQNTTSAQQSILSNTDDPSSKEQLLQFLSFHRFAYYHDSVDPYIMLDIDNDKFVIKLDDSGEIPAHRLWVESYWDTATNIKYFPQTTQFYTLISALVAVVVLLVSTCLGRYIYKTHVKPTKTFAHHSQNYPTME